MAVVQSYLNILNDFVSTDPRFGILMKFFYARLRSLLDCQQEFCLNRVLIVPSHLAYCKVYKHFWCTCAYQGVWNVSFSEKFSNVLNGWYLCPKQNNIKINKRIEKIKIKTKKWKFLWKYFNNNFNIFWYIFDISNPARVQITYLLLKLKIVQFQVHVINLMLNVLKRPYFFNTGIIW